jgi:hypothetical protein
LKGKKKDGQRQNHRDRVYGLVRLGARHGLRLSAHFKPNIAGGMQTTAS